MKWITDRCEKILVRSQDFTLRSKFNHGLSAADRIHFSRKVDTLLLLLGDIRSVLNHFIRFARVIHDWVVTGLNPDTVTGFIEAFVFSGLKLTSVQRIPECRVLCTVGVRRGHEHTVMLSLNFIQAVTHCIQKILICSDDGAVHIKFD